MGRIVIDSPATLDSGPDALFLVVGGDHDQESHGSRGRRAPSASDERCRGDEGNKEEERGDHDRQCQVEIRNDQAHVAIPPVSSDPGPRREGGKPDSTPACRPR